LFEKVVHSVRIRSCVPDHTIGLVEDRGGRVGFAWELEYAGSALSRACKIESLTVKNAQKEKHVKLGTVTYQIAKDMDVASLIELCQKTGLTGVELRAEHAHGVELGLNASQRSDVKKRFEDGGIEIVGLGSIYEFHAVEPEVVRKNIEGAIAYARLAADLGCSGIKCRPNGLQVDNGIPEEKTLEQIGLSMRECAQAAADLGVEVRLEIHSRETNQPTRMRTIMDHADHPNATVCWNSTPPDIVDGSVKSSYELLKDKLTLYHLHELSDPAYPYRELLSLLKADGFEGYTLIEIGPSDNPERLLNYYRELWTAWVE
jgi:sugar phosphate isomerase/epimerase